MTNHPNRSKRSVQPFQVGDRVEGGDTHEDYDTGRVVSISGEWVTVSWDSGIRTGQSFRALRPEGVRPIR